MNSYTTLKQEAIKLRKQGATYKKILEQVPVAKSTLSLWLRDVSLAKKQRQQITENKKRSQQLAAQTRKLIRVKQEEDFKNSGLSDVGNLSKRELFLIGISLYWAEGTKKIGRSVSVPVEFANSDPAMISLFVTWLKEFGEVTEADITLRLHVHESHIVHESRLKHTWAEAINLPVGNFSKTMVKRHNSLTVRHKIGKEYIGLVSVRVKASVRLNRRIMGLIHAIIAAQKQ